ncbi:hypothetical protein IU500_13390 [Nocardia terpenica]|uniref:hypothetical protein n=1 Tax=Nocardia terpenica TaxID=455432 RepID=UPI0018958B06|nr:hypothetical protein [Nocardia terpenica]MBF6062829.1 hypothetical protein [Nocardia terpenica]MBF6105036.1 hypothetical protein [Nocardia terpenica]MBF6112527.1 hypothetical protein [Nocardia terpenica]MBF6118764.1 hypothetical protein [Nocardia terpenica]MBF6154233.1 hypothetical protein [Nocardia terpenica]
MTEHASTPDRDVVDAIDALVDEQLAAGPDRGAADRCPHCPEGWHALPITAAMLTMMLCECSDCERDLAQHDYAADTTRILCPGSDFIGPLPPLDLDAVKAVVGVVTVALGLPVRPVPDWPAPPSGCALRIPFSETGYRGEVFAYRLSIPWRAAEYVIVMHHRRPTDTGEVRQTVLFRYCPPGTPQPRIIEAGLVDGFVLGVVDDGDDDGYRAGIDSNGVLFEFDAEMRSRYHASGWISPDLFVQQVTGQMVVGIVDPDS